MRSVGREDDYIENCEFFPARVRVGDLGMY